jgi:hypothetical protein
MGFCHVFKDMGILNEKIVIFAVLAALASGRSTVFKR